MPSRAKKIVSGVQRVTRFFSPRSFNKTLGKKLRAGAAKEFQFHRKTASGRRFLKAKVKRSIRTGSSPY